MTPSFPPRRPSAHARLLPGDLTRTAVAAQLRHRLVREAETVQTTGADLAAEGVQRQLAIERDALTAFDVLAAVADLAETQRFDPGQRLETETVVELRGIDVGRLVVGLLPQIAAGRVAGHPLGLIPAQTLDAARHRRNADRRALHFVERIAGGDDQHRRGIGDRKSTRLNSSH